MFPIDDPKQAMRYETAARLSAFWFINNQCTEHKPWSGIHDSADNGRYIYEYYVATGWSRAMGVWGQANGIMACLACAAGVSGPSIETMGVANHCVLSAVRAATYMMSLQVLDSRKAFAFGAFREHAPTTNFSFPRDAATGAFGLLAMYRLTGWQEYLDRAVLFADWYRTYGSDKDGWPHVTFYFDDGKTADESAKGIWQAGGALTYHYLYELTGDKKWLEPLKVIVDRAVDLLEKGDTETTGAASHHGMRGNDDFCTTVLLAAWEQFKDRKYLVRFAKNINLLMERQHADGSCHGMAGEYMTGLEMLDAWQVRDQLKGLVDESKLRTALLKAADFGLTQQELAVHNIRLYGGIYGQNWYGVARDRIHQRSTGYGSALYSRLVAKEPLPYWSAMTWKAPAQKLDINRYFAMDAERVY
jgi:hypothetical protein